MSYSGRRLRADPFTDLLFNILLSFTLLMFLAIIFMNPIPKTLTDSNKIKVVDIMVSLRSQSEFFRKEQERPFRLLGQKSNKKFTDKFLREALVVSAHTRNMGL